MTSEYWGAWAALLTTLIVGTCIGFMASWVKGRVGYNWATFVYTISLVIWGVALGLVLGSS